MIKKPYVKPLRRVAAIISLILPTACYAGLAYVMPLQYRFVLIDALVTFWPFAFTLSILVFFSICALWLLRAHNVLDPFMACVASSATFTALSTWLLVDSQSHLALLVAGFLAAVVLGTFYVAFNSQGRWLSLPAAIRSIWAPPIAALAVYAGFGIASWIEPLYFPRAIGSCAVFAAFAGAATVVICSLCLNTRALIVASGYCLLAVAILSQNNHFIRAVETTTHPTEMGQAFRSWIGSRADLDAYKSGRRPYPVFVVSSEGGGIYAAAHAYGVLSTFAQHCPTFSQHIFAAVGVSGGAFGNALFSASLDPKQKLHRPCGPAATAIDPAPIIADHLSPVLARMLLLETVDRLLPGTWLARDRAQLLVDSFTEVARDRPYLESAITEGFNPTSARPALLTVTVDVAKGTRLVLSPFYPDRYSGLASWGPRSDTTVSDPEYLQINLINAAGASARFPWITPTGRLPLRDRALILADGGYFDNSGADTALDVIDGLRLSRTLSRETEHTEECSELKVRFVHDFYNDTIWESCEVPVFLAYFALASRGSENLFEEEAVEDVLPSFLLDPLRTLLSTRASRADIALDKAAERLCATTTKILECAFPENGSIAFFRNDIFPKTLDLPLGWYMPGGSFARMVESAVPSHIFDYRRRQQPAGSAIELLVFHLDPELFNDGADPSVYDLLLPP